MLNLELEVNQTVKVKVDSQDIVDALRTVYGVNAPEEILNTLGALLREFSDEQIQNLSNAQRELLANFLKNQAARFEIQGQEPLVQMDALQAGTIDADKITPASGGIKGLKSTVFNNLSVAMELNDSNTNVVKGFDEPVCTCSPEAHQGIAMTLYVNQSTFPGENDEKAES